VRNSLKRIAANAMQVLPQSLIISFKHSRELAFWMARHRESAGSLRNSHYEYFYTNYFGIDKQEYTDKAILDVGCGPRGSLEWADNVKERIGLDPLVDRYQQLGIDAHKMSYVCAPSEKIPSSDEHFDFVVSFNSLDHVDDIDKTLSEVTRVLKSNGLFLLITEINHIPTPTEPHTISEDLIERLSNDFYCEKSKLTSIRGDHDIYESLIEAKPYTPGDRKKPGILSARLRKKSR
jgi:ubiquinone/menaquinone biosynthesis C-methylase UbiE